MNDLTEDLRTRMAPTEQQLADTRSSGDTGTGYVPICFPHKEYGWWKLDTQVEHPGGVFVTREDAALAAAKHLNGRPGTAGYVWITPDRWAVFEEILSPERLIELS
jgi:hypothetical protein